jgi:hypothetical protein
MMRFEVALRLVNFVRILPILHRTHLDRVHDTGPFEASVLTRCRAVRQVPLPHRATHSPGSLGASFAVEAVDDGDQSAIASN